MKLELKENMYVRNCYGRIAKIEDIEDNIAYCDNWLYQRYEEFITFIDLNNEKDINKITKVSYNIIDILEVGDYVNGYPIYEIVECEDDTRAIVIADDNKSIIWKKQNIKSVITHEQMEQMAYKAGE